MALDATHDAQVCYGNVAVAIIFSESTWLDTRSLIYVCARSRYFNNLNYDDVVEAIAHVMLISSRLFVKGQERPDELNKKEP